MKRLLLFVTAVMILDACASNAVSSSEDNARKDRKGWYGHELYGNVASVTKKTYDLNMKFGEETLGELKSSHQYVFNEAGDVIKDVYTHYSSSGDSFSYASVNVYDDKRNILETTTYNYEGEISGKYINEFDGMGNRISESHYGSDGKLEAKIIFKYNENGKCIARSDYDAEGVLETQYLLEYDERGNNVSEKVYAFDNTLTKRILRTFNDDNKCIEYKEFEIIAMNSDVDLYAVTDTCVVTGIELNRNRGKDIKLPNDSGVSLFDERSVAGKSVEESIVLWYKFTYDDHANLNEGYELAADGTHKNKYIYSYKDGKVSELVNYDPLGMMTAKEIILRDRHGNVIESTEYEYKGPIEFPSQKAIYEIEYFE